MSTDSSGKTRINQPGLARWRNLSSRSKPVLFFLLLVVITLILSVAALHAIRPVAMPLAFAGLLAVLVNPLRSWLNQKLPKWLSLVIVLVIIMAFLGILVGVLLLGIEQVEPQLPRYTDQLQQVWQSTSTWLQNWGVPINAGSTQSNTAWQTILDRAVIGIRSLLGSVSLFVLIISLLALLLLEVDEYRSRTRAAFSSGVGERLIDAFANMSQKLQRYFMVMAFTSFLTGILTFLWCWIFGIDSAIVWGLLAFVLNFVPTLGSIVAAIVPALVATLFQGPGKGIIILVGLAVIQIVLGNFVDPKLQGKYLKLSPFIALLSIIFWGWVWGIPGAFIGVPMTTAIIMLTHEFKLTRPVAIMLGSSEDKAQ